MTACLVSERTCEQVEKVVGGMLERKIPDLNLSKNFSYEHFFILINVHFPNMQKTFCSTAMIYQMSTKDYVTLMF